MNQHILDIHKVLGHPDSIRIVRDWDNLANYIANESLDVKFTYGDEYNYKTWQTFEELWKDRGLIVIVEVAIVRTIIPLDAGMITTFELGNYLVARFNSIENAVWFKLSLPENMRNIPVNNRLVK